MQCNACLNIGIETMRLEWDLVKERERSIKLKQLIVLKTLTTVGHQNQSAFLCTEITLLNSLTGHFLHFLKKDATQVNACFSKF